MKTLKKENLTRIGIVRKLSGYHGALICQLEIEHAETLRKKKFLFILLEGLPVPFQVEESDINGQELFVKFFDVNSEIQAKKLVRKELFTEKTASKVKEQIAGWKDLVGFHVTDQSIGYIGEIQQVQELPMQMIAYCIVKGKEVLFPLNNEIVLDIDEEEKRILVDLPEGLLDIYLE